MKVFRNDRVIAFDVDDTLVMWGRNFDKPFEGCVEVLDVHDGKMVYLTPHLKHVRDMIIYKKTGWTVMVWSAGGYEWAESVISTLGIKKYVDLVMTKPSRLYDDLPLDQALGVLYYKPLDQNEES